MLETLPTEGNYTLIIRLKAPSHTRVGKHGQFSVEKGYYAYNGSALGNGATSLRQRVARHLRKQKKPHWHIDYLLAERGTVITAVIASESKVNKECEITKAMQRIHGITLPIPGFGSSDCRQNCRSHLLYLRASTRLDEIAKIYRSTFGGARTVRFQSSD